MLRPNLALWVVVASFAAWLASCSSDVDGYFIATNESSSTLSGGSAGMDQSGGAAGRVSTSGGTGQGGGAGGIESDSGAGGQTLTSSGGAGGANTGGTDASVTNGGSGNGGTGGATGGVPNTGGANTGGTNTGGTGTGGTNTGGTGTGGTGTGGTNTGGTGTGGANTGGIGTGGINTGGTGTGGRGTGGTNTGGTGTGGIGTGGTNTGGAGTGGTNTGGTGTGGATGGTGGGTGGYPGDPTQVSLSASVTGITAAAWEPTSGRFFLLQPSAAAYWILSTSGTATGPVALQGAGTVAQTAFGASATDVYFVRGTTATLYRQPITNGTAFTKNVPGNPALPTLSGAFAKGWFFLGNTSGASQALPEGQTTFDGSAALLSGVNVVTSDTASFVFRTVGTGNRAVVHRIAPGSFALNSSPCDGGTFNGNLDRYASVYGTSVAWVIVIPATSTLYQLNVASIAAGGCNTPLQSFFGSSDFESQAVGLIDAEHALVTSLVQSAVATIEIVRAGDQTFSRTPLDANMGASGFPQAFVVGALAPAQTHRAVLVTKNIPVLISF